MDWKAGGMGGSELPGGADPYSHLGIILLLSPDRYGSFLKLDISTA